MLAAWWLTLSACSAGRWACWPGPCARRAVRAASCCSPTAATARARRSSSSAASSASPTAGASSPDEHVGRDALDLGRRLLRRGSAARSWSRASPGRKQRVATDRDGYFRVHLRPRHRRRPAACGTPIDLELLRPVAVKAEGELFVPPATCRFVVISDIDDTVMHTGVASKAMMLWRLFMQVPRAGSPSPGWRPSWGPCTPGAPGPSTTRCSTSPAPPGQLRGAGCLLPPHGIPVGPLLFLREWGLTVQSPLPRRGKGHKLELIRNMLALYHDLPFVLIGDSGQRDPEIYARVVREHPGRVLAVYVRNVSRDPDARPRHRGVGPEVAGAGSALVLAADSFAMAEHAAARGLIALEALAEVFGSRRSRGAGRHRRRRSRSCGRARAPHARP